MKDGNSLRRRPRGRDRHPGRNVTAAGAVLLWLFSAGLAMGQEADAPPAQPGPAGASPAAAASTAEAGQATFEDILHAAILRHLGKPYVWGATGLKSFDCSGFVWRVLFDSGILIKRTTARKLYMCLPKVGAGEQLRFGRLVFFDNRTHLGIVNDPDTFYHAQCSKGTNLSPFRPYWRGKVCGYRALPAGGQTE